MKVRFNRRANREARSIAEYYTREAGAKHVQEFLNDLDKIIDRTTRWPRSFPLIDTNIRRALLSKCTFVVVYEIESDECSRILAES